MYKYKLRPGYKSSELLIEFNLKSANNEFFESLYQALKSCGLQKRSTTDLWMNEEVLIEFGSIFGDFELSIDIWDDVFIMSPNNQGVIIKIDEILSKNSAFTKQKVNFDVYK